MSTRIEWLPDSNSWAGPKLLLVRWLIDSSLLNPFPPVFPSLLMSPFQGLRHGLGSPSFSFSSSLQSPHLPPWEEVVRHPLAKRSVANQTLSDCTALPISFDCFDSPLWPRIYLLSCTFWSYWRPWIRIRITCHDLFWSACNNYFQQNSPLWEDQHLHRDSVLGKENNRSGERPVRGLFPTLERVSQSVRSLPFVFFRVTRNHELLQGSI